MDPKQSEDLTGWKKQRSEIEDAEVAEFVGQGIKDLGTEWRRCSRHRHRDLLKVLSKSKCAEQEHTSVLVGKNAGRVPEVTQAETSSGQPE